MELEVSIVLSILGIFVSLIGMKIFFVYTKANHEQYKILHTRDLDKDWINMQRELEIANTAVHNWQQRHKALKNQGIDYEDLELVEGDDEQTALGKLAKSFNLPKPLQEVMDNEEFQESIAGVLKSHGPALMDHLGTYLNSKKKGSAATPAITDYGI